jgi:hypothetical protein
MKEITMIKKVLYTFILGWFLTSSLSVFSQCRTDLNLGQNLVVNGDFSGGYSNWNFDAGVGGYKIKGGGNSNPGDLIVGTNPATFNTGGGGFPPFDTYGDHTTGSGNFLMVDGQCSGGATTIKVWYQTVNVEPFTNYYFSVWISSLKDMPTNPGNLRFNIGGSVLGANILAPSKGGATAAASGGGWIRYVTVWNSGAVSGPVLISIQNNNTASCSSEVDFGIDDIAFTPGCDFGVPGPQPNLGPDQSLCGKGGSITLNANVPMNATTTVSWSDGTSNTGANPAFYSRVITTPGTYSVCVSDNGSCTKSDVIVITNTYSINIGGPYSFCTTTSQVLDAGYTGIGVTYQWYRNGTLVPFPNNTKTYTATSAGTYRVDVNVPGCGAQSSTTTITSTSSITPVDAYYCANTSSVNGLTLAATSTNSSNLGWYTTATGGTAIASGVTTPTATTSQYAVPTIPMGTTATQTYYVQDETPTAGTAGTAALSTTNLNTVTGWAQPFNIVGDVTVNSLQVPFTTYYSPPAGFPGFTITVEVLTSTGASFSPAKTFTSGASTPTIPGNDGGNRRIYTFPFTGFTILSSWGSSLRLKLTAHTHPNGAALANQGGAGFTYPMTSTPTGAISITGAVDGSGNTQAGAYSYFYNWDISSKYSCSRIPVRAINNCPTPVTWKSFYLMPQDNSCKMVWSTADETNNSYFAIERSVDGINFETIGSVSGAGNRDYASNYFYVDNAPLSGTSYYRITQHDYDGKFSSTVMRPYSSQGLIQVTIYPNPFHHNTNLVVSGADNETYTYTLHSVNGQLVEQGSGTINQVQTIAEAQSKGMYMLTVLTSTDIVTTKIVKQ